MIRPATAADAPALAALYNHYIAHSLATFEEDALPDSVLAERLAGVTARGYPWLVDMVDGALRGYAYADILKPRTAYRFAVETTVYVQPALARKGVGRALYVALLAQLRRDGVQTAIGILTVPNAASVALHESLGFKQAGLLRRVGFKFGQWADVGHWQLQLGESE